MKTITTWAGSKVDARRIDVVLLGWQRYAKSLERELKRLQPGFIPIRKRLFDATKAKH